MNYEKYMICIYLFVCKAHIILPIANGCLPNLDVLAVYMYVLNKKA